MTKDWFPIVDTNLCKADCFICIRFCPNKVFTKEDGTAKVTAPENCVDQCNSCETMCPQKAIRFQLDTITIDGINVGVNGLKEALATKDVDKAMKIILTRNYVAEDLVPKVREAIIKILGR